MSTGSTGGTGSTDDLLSRATRALRETTAPTEDDDDRFSEADRSSDADAPSSDSNDSPTTTTTTATQETHAVTLARIERSTRTRRAHLHRRTKYTRWIVMPMAASFLVFCAWASASGRLTQWTSSWRSHEDPEAMRVGSSPSASAAAPQTAYTILMGPAIRPLPSATPVVEEPAPSASTSASTAASSQEPPSPAPTKKAPQRNDAVDADALYRDAHEAHFVRRDPAAALTAWDRYLAAAGPSGRFTLEARYNRAISLVRLGRKSEAKAALQPFAKGEYGGYRRDEATDLLRTLE